MSFNQCRTHILFNIMYLIAQSAREFWLPVAHVKSIMIFLQNKWIPLNKQWNWEVRFILMLESLSL